jgi:hypothetical protein
VACAGAAAPTVTSESWGRGLRFGLVPLRAGLTYWFAVTSAREAAERPHSVFAGWHSPIADVLTAPQAGSTPVLPLEDLPPLRSWHDGRSTAPDALAAYEHRRKRRAELVVARLRSTGRIAQAANPATAFLRDTMASVTFDRLALRQAAAILQPSA